MTVVRRAQRVNFDKAPFAKLYSPHVGRGDRAGSHASDSGMRQASEPLRAKNSLGNMAGTTIQKESSGAGFLDNGIFRQNQKEIRARGY